MPSHIQISTTIIAENIELLSDIFSELGALAVTMIDAKDEPLFQLTPEDEPHWQHTTVNALFDETVFPEQLVDHIKQHTEFQSLQFTVERIANENWVLKTQKQFHAQKFGKLWICPEWEKKNFNKEHRKATVVFIEPGLAFGTGTHPTTQLCLTWLSNNNLRGKTAIDYGCGSGILALSALALGVKIVYATDHDNQALESTQNNLQYNNFDHRKLSLRKTNEMRNIKAEIMLANILANPLIELAPTLTNLLLPNGKLILSGVLGSDANRVFSAYQNHFELIEMKYQDEWVLMELQKRRSR